MHFSMMTKSEGELTYPQKPLSSPATPRPSPGMFPSSTISSGSFSRSASLNRGYDDNPLLTCCLPIAMSSKKLKEKMIQLFIDYFLRMNVLFSVWINLIVSKKLFSVQILLENEIIPVLVFRHTTSKLYQ